MRTTTFHVVPAQAGTYTPCRLVSAGGRFILQYRRPGVMGPGVRRDDVRGIHHHSAASGFAAARISARVFGLPLIFRSSKS
jgi:hypothetical protein